tara:strand:+ start:3581 stop:4225 length:645 start_codon:yes stop_codon:yes gene_type:complete
MNRLHKDLRTILFYNEERMVYERNGTPLVTDSKWSEFRHILETQFQTPFDPRDFKADDNDGLDNIAEYSEEKCICTHPIINLYYLTHTKTQMTFKVGSKCITRLDHSFEKAVKSIVKERKYRAEGNICIYCDKTLTDMRKQYQKEHCCNLVCNQKFNHRIPFGKHYGKNLLEFICTKEGNNYVNWVKDVIKDDKTQFKKYTLFLEIIYENDVDI